MADPVARLAALAVEAPDHPAIVCGAAGLSRQGLDLLARRLIDGGWSVKALIRELVLARPYRQSSTFREAAFVKDPDNRLLWRMPPRRVTSKRTPRRRSSRQHSRTIVSV